MASPTTVTYGLDTPGGAARAGVSVTADLVGAGDRNDDVGVVGGTVTATTAADGSFTLSLLPNSVYEQAGTYYAVNVAGGPSYNIVVPVSAIPVDLWTIRVDPRTLDPVAAAVPPIYLTRAELGVAGGPASLDLITGKVPVAQLPPIAGGGVASVNEIEPDVDGDVTLTAADVGAAATVHTHAISAVTGLQAALDGKEASGTAATAVAAHVAAVDPHPQYLTAAEGAAAYDAINAASSAVTAHTGASNPHPEYLTPAEGDAAYAAAAHTHIIGNVTGLQTALDGKAPLDSPAFTGTPTGITKAHVGLGNVDNTSDAGKPVSTATQTALDGKATKPRFAALVKTDANIQLNTGLTTWGVLTGAPTLAIAAVAGDLIELNVQQLRQTNTNIFLDWCVIVSAAPVRYMGTLSGTPAGEGNPALYHTNLPSAGGVWKWLAQPGDISGGNVTVGIAIRNLSGASSLLLASTDNPLQLALENRGPTL